jgi:hypothetical protein
MKNIALLFILLFNFAFAKNAVAAVPSPSVLSGISMPKDSTIMLSESEYKALLKAKKEVLRSLKIAKITANIGLLLLLFALASFLAFFIGRGFVLAGTLILIGSLITLYLIIKMRKIKKILRKYPLLEADPIIAEESYLASAKLGILCAVFSVLLLSTVLLMITEGVFFSLLNPVVLIASIVAIVASIFGAIFFKTNH